MFVANRRPQNFGVMKFDRSPGEQTFGPIIQPVESLLESRGRIAAAIDSVLLLPTTIKPPCSVLSDVAPLSGRTSSGLVATLHFRQSRFVS
jgi:hypothetical protein